MNRLNVDRLAQVLSEILSEKHGADVTVEFHKRDQDDDQHTAEAIA